MMVTSASLAAGTQVLFVVSLDGGGTIDQATASSEAGKASAPWHTWFKPEMVTSPQTVNGDAGEKFKEVKYSFKASAGSKSATTSTLITYSEKLSVKLVDENNNPVAKTLVTVISPWGTLTVTTDESGGLELDGLPPGGVHLTLD